MAVILGLERLVNSSSIQQSIKGTIGHLCHSASIDRDYTLSVIHLQKIFGKRLDRLFGPQHGFVTDVQDNMKETADYIHPFFNLNVHSLYSKTRAPTEQMLHGLDTIIVDLQDVGTRVYTYISTLTLLMEKCAQKDIKVIILDRPNPVGGTIIEGNCLCPGFESFVGRHPIPMRHGLTFGEMACLAQKYFNINCDIQVIKMSNWKREMYFEDTFLPWVLPSPNLPTIEGAKTFVGTVIFEGTNISEGRGTTRSLELIGHPDIEPFEFCNHLQRKIKDWNLSGFILRPIVFQPTFQKFQGTTCGGFQIHITNNDKFRGWKLAQFLCQELKKYLKSNFTWNTSPYEYELLGMPIDFINGTDLVRKWVDNFGTEAELDKIEQIGHDQFLNKKANIELYP